MTHQSPATNVSNPPKRVGHAETWWGLFGKEPGDGRFATAMDIDFYQSDDWRRRQVRFPQLLIEMAQQAQLISAVHP